MDRNFKFNPEGAKDPIIFESIHAEKSGGGIMPNQTLDLHAGQAVGFNSDGKFEALKAFVVAEDAASNATSIKIAKGSGCTSSTVIGVGKKAVAATAIDTTTSTDYDTVTVSLGVAVKAGQILFEAEAASDGSLAGYYDSASGTTGALKVVASGATTGEINISDVAPYFGRQELAANDYVIFKSPATPKIAPLYILGTDVKSGQGAYEVKLVNGANIRKETALVADEVVALMPQIFKI